MNPFEFVIAIIAITTIGSIIRAKYLGPRRHRSRRGLMDRHGDFHGEERDTYAEDRETVRLREEVKMLKERLHTLERIAVDKENSLARQIDDLRDRP